MAGVGNGRQALWIARHGNRLDFVRPEWFDTAERPYDPPLSEDGWIQGRQLGERLRKESIAHIFCSPFLRAIQTAECVSQALELPFKIEAGLSEWLNPHWMAVPPQTHPPELLRQRHPRIDWDYRSRVVPQYPESEAALRQRAKETAARLTAEFPQDILLVGHQPSAIAMALALVAGNPPLEAPLASLFKLTGWGGGWQLELNGDTSHLQSVG